MAHNRGWSIMSIACAVCALAMIAIPVAFPVCSGMVETVSGSAVPMRCYWPFRVTTVLAIVLLLGNLICLRIHTPAVRRTFAALMAAVVVCAGIIPTSLVIGVCAAEGMACRTTFTLFGVCVLLYLVFAVFQICSAAPERKKLPKRTY